MPGENKETIFFLIFLLFLFGAGILKLFAIRFESGDYYPAYSSLRADPYGTKILFETLSGIKGIRSIRNYSPSEKLSGKDPVTLFYLSGSDFFVLYQDEPGIKQLDRVAENGGRVVVIFRPALLFEKEKEEADSARAKKDPEKKREPSAAEKRWGFAFASRHEDNSGANPALFNPNYREILTPSLPWMTHGYFEKTDPAWQEIYFKRGLPVLMERNWGKGTLVIGTDPYFLSNEAMIADRHPEIVSWLIGTNRKIIFEETHLGVKDDPGVVSLARKYRLTPFLLALLLVSALAVWKNSRNLVPPLPEEEEVSRESASEGKDDLSGLSGLFKRKVPADSIVEACFSEWKKWTLRKEHTPVAWMKEAEALALSKPSGKRKDRNPVNSYNTITALVRERSRHHESNH